MPPHTKQNYKFLRAKWLELDPKARGEPKPRPRIDVFCGTVSRLVSRRRFKTAFGLAWSAAKKCNNPEILERADKIVREGVAARFAEKGLPDFRSLVAGLMREHPLEAARLVEFIRLRAGRETAIARRFRSKDEIFALTRLELDCLNSARDNYRQMTFSGTTVLD